MIQRSARIIRKDEWADYELQVLYDGNYILDSRTVIGYISTSHVDKPVTFKELPI